MSAFGHKPKGGLKRTQGGGCLPTILKNKYPCMCYFQMAHLQPKHHLWQPTPLRHLSQAQQHQHLWVVPEL